MSRKRHKFDKDATAQAGFLDGRSYITLFGKEYRFGKDMETIRLQVFERAGAYCQALVHQKRCFRRLYWESFHMHHVKHRGRGGDDSLGNLAAWCYECHMVEHN